ncbi:MAG TPA: hypothetical protein VJ917_05835 [Saprospiraceae bacterium]|nr:hypothetical protein [Saprospiraceae bacterium]
MKREVVEDRKWPEVFKGAIGERIIELLKMSGTQKMRSQFAQGECPRY